MRTVNFELTLEEFLTLNDLVFYHKIDNYGHKDKTLNSLREKFSRNKIELYPIDEADTIRQYIHRNDETIKKLSKEERKQKLLELKYPNDCFCERHTYLNPVREEMWDNHPVYQPEGKHKTTIYKCENCGKEYTDEPAWA
jgi:hypothetical protein